MVALSNDCSGPALTPRRPHKGALLIPAFAVERTQELIVDLVDLMARGEVPTAPIFLEFGPPRSFDNTRRASIQRSTLIAC